MKRIERLKLYPTRRQTLRLQLCLDVCRQLYNVALEQRRSAWRERQLSITYKVQYQQLTQLRAADRRMAAIFRELQDATLHKLDLAFAAFFRRVRAGQTPRLPTLSRSSPLFYSGVSAWQSSSQALKRAVQGASTRGWKRSHARGPRGASLRSRDDCEEPSRLVCAL